MAKLVVEITSTIGTLDLTRLCVNEDLSKYQILTNLLNYVGGLQSGTPFRPCTFEIANETEAVAASATVTAASVDAADTVTVNGVVFTAVSDSTPAANQFDMSGTDDETAASLANAINITASALAQLVTAVAVDDVVTISAKQPGLVGNAYTLVTSNNSRLANSVVATGRLAGGLEDPNAITLTF